MSLGLGPLSPTVDAVVTALQAATAAAEARGALPPNLFPVYRCALCARVGSCACHNANGHLFARRD